MGREKISRQTILNKVYVLVQCRGVIWLSVLKPVENHCFNSLTNSTAACRLESHHEGLPFTGGQKHVSYLSDLHSLSLPLKTEMPWLLFHGTDGVWAHYLSTETLRRKRLSICWSLDFFQTLSPFSSISRIPYTHFRGFQQYDITAWLCCLLGHNDKPQARL